MASIKAYIFDSEKEAIELINSINKLKGFPTADGSTLTYCTFEVNDGVVFIRHTDFIQSLLSQNPVYLEIKEQSIFTP